MDNTMENEEVSKSKRSFLTTSTVIAGTGLLIGPAALGRSVRSCIAEPPPSPADTIIANLRNLANIHHGFPIDQLRHGLQTATLAQDAGEDDEVVLGCLCHDIAKNISAFGHEEMGAEMLRPYVRDDVYNMLKYHGVFQGRFFWDKIGRDKDLYKKFMNETWGPLAYKFTGNYDRLAFNKDPVEKPLDHFIPLIRKLVKTT